MNARDIWTLYLHELRSALRERSIVVYSLLIPAVLYPLLLWFAWTGATFVLGQTSGLSARVALVNIPEAHAGLRAELDAVDSIEIVDLRPGEAPPGPDAVRSGALEVIVDGAALRSNPPSPSPPSSEAGALGDLSVTLTYDGSRDHSQAAADRVVEVLNQYRHKARQNEGRRRGVSPAEWTPFRVASRSVASGREMGAFLLTLVIPMLLLVMTSMGCFYPAVDTTAGERERSTWETLMTISASRSSIVIAKYLYVATLGAAAGLLNLAGVILSMRAIFASALGKKAESVRLEMPLSAFPIMVLCAVLIALLVAAAMMILASLARTFKEGQAMITPFYMTIALPALLLQSPDIKLTPALASIPLVNVTMLFRDAIGGSLRAPLVALTAVTQLAAIALCLSIAAKLTRFEDVVAGSFREGETRLRLPRLFQRDRPTRDRAAPKDPR